MSKVDKTIKPFTVPPPSPSDSWEEEEKEEKTK